jgi:DNA-directed RNA polymerase subunit F
MKLMEEMTRLVHSITNQISMRRTKAKHLYRSIHIQMQRILFDGVIFDADNSLRDEEIKKELFDRWFISAVDELEYIESLEEEAEELSAEAIFVRCNSYLRRVIAEILPRLESDIVGIMEKYYAPREFESLHQMNTIIRQVLCGIKSNIKYITSSNILLIQIVNTLDLSNVPGAKIADGINELFK